MAVTYFTDQPLTNSGGAETLALDGRHAADTLYLISFSVVDGDGNPVSSPTGTISGGVSPVGASGVGLDSLDDLDLSTDSNYDPFIHKITAAQLSVSGLSDSNHQVIVTIFSERS